MNTPADPLAPPSLAWFADLRVEVGAPLVLGHGPHGTRRVVPITGGEAHGEGWRARAARWRRLPVDPERHGV